MPCDIDILDVIQDTVGTGVTVYTADTCDFGCEPMWRDSGPAVCIAGVSKIPQVDGCGGSRMVNGGSACCVPNWAPTGNQKCEAAVSYIEEYDGCGQYRWIQGGSACCIPNWANTNTQKCVDAISYQLWVDGCGAQEWRTGGNACPIVVPPDPLVNTGIYTVQYYAPPYDGYWSVADNCGFIIKHRVRIDWWETSPYAAVIKDLAFANAKITLHESWVDAVPYLGNEWSAAAGPVKMLRFDLNGSGPEVGYLTAESRGGIVEVFLQLYGWRKFDNTITWCNGATTSLTYPTDGTSGTYLGLHSLVYPPQANGSDYRVAPFMSNMWKDAAGYHFVTLDTMYRNDSTSRYLGQAVGVLGDAAAGSSMVSDVVIGTCGITASRSVLEFDATCLLPSGGA